MKKFLLMVFLVILFVVEVSAIDYRLVGGINVSRMIEGPIFAGSGHFDSCGVGFLLGGGAEFTLSKNMSIELDGLYFQKSSVFKCWHHEEFRDCFCVLHEISFPVLVKFKHLFNSPFFLLGGGEFACVISEEGADKFDYGAVFGVGVEIKKIISSIEIRCHIGHKANTIALVLGFF